VSDGSGLRSPEEVRQRYVAEAQRCAAAREPEARRSLTIARLRLGTAIPGAACLVWMMAGGPLVPLGVGATLFFAAFTALVIWHARVEARLTWADALRVVNERGAARVARDWANLPPGDAPPGVVTTDHPYATDLDLFGRASLFQWLGPAATALGSRRLAEWLLTPAPRDEIVQRQEAVATLAAAAGWREHFAAHGVASAPARHAEVESFLAWAEGPPLFGNHERLMHVAVILLTATIWILLAVFLLNLTDTGFWLLPMLAGIVLSFAVSGRIQLWLDRAGGGQYAMRRYAPLLAHVTAAPREGRRLAEIHERLTAGGLAAPACLRRLNRILGFGDLRRGAAIFHFPIQAITLWDFHVVFALERWRRTAGASVRRWLDAVGELDALSLLASLRHDNQSWAQPVVTDAAIIDASALGHPLIADDRRVSNDVRIGPAGTLLLVTGSNMSGKSTLLRGVGLNLVLAQAGAAVAARSFSLPQTDLQTSLRVQDSLELGLSYFMAALARLKGVVDAAEHERPGRVLVYLLDEILQGTNSVERTLAVRSVARHLLDAGAIGAMTTHDLSLAAEEPLSSAAQLVHFTELVGENGEMRFDYRLRPGLATSRNALRLMKLIGIDP
jgi:hypothetical protein